MQTIRHTPLASPGKAVIKTIRSLGQKKHREATGLFVAEGPKVVADIMERAAPVTLVATAPWWELHGATVPAEAAAYAVDDAGLAAVSFLQHPQQVVAVFRQGDMGGDRGAAVDAEQLYIALDGVQDPGNLGTIVRVADWFGVTRLFCSPVTADVWNPKVVQATMGSVARVSVEYTPLPELIDRLPAGFPVYGTLLDGDDIHTAELACRGLLVMGNEAAGLSDDVRRRVTQRLLIPSYPQGRATADSLNVAIATAIATFALRSYAGAQRRAGHEKTGLQAAAFDISQ